jgi:hypothetical protein
MYRVVNGELSMSYGKEEESHNFGTAFLDKCRDTAVTKAKFIYNNILYLSYRNYSAVANLYVPTEGRDKY